MGEVRRGMETMLPMMVAGKEALACMDLSLVVWVPPGPAQVRVNWGRMRRAGRLPSQGLRAVQQ